MLYGCSDLLITDRASRESKAIDIASVCPSGLFLLYLLNRLIFELLLFMCVVHDHSSYEIEGQGQRSKVDV